MIYGFRPRPPVLADLLDAINLPDIFDAEASYAQLKQRSVNLEALGIIVEAQGCVMDYSRTGLRIRFAEDMA